MATVLGVRGTQFTLNHQPTFLLGVNYCGGLSAPEEFVRRDLTDFQQFGVNCVRIWANWRVSHLDVAALDRQGNPREPFLSKLQWFVRECDRRGFIVGVTIGRGNASGEPQLANHEAHLRAVAAVLQALGVFENWYLDMATERNLRDARFVHMDEVKALRDAAKAQDARRLVTASHSGDLPREEMTKYLFNGGVDFLAFHRPCTPRTAGKTAEWTAQYREWLRALDHEMPVLYQESLHRGTAPRYELTAQDLLQDFQSAYTAGAAGWFFTPHEKIYRFFDLRQQRLWDQLDGEEKAFFQQVWGAM